MEYIQAIILGVIEGLTEFLPISSTGHLIVAQDMLGFYDASRMFTVVIQMGAIAAVIWFYRSHILSLVRGLLAGDSGAKSFWLIWVVATIPAGIFGLILKSSLEEYGSSLLVATALIVGGALILVIESRHKIAPVKKSAELDKISLKQAFIIGVYQILALIPGVSRSGATIMGGLLTGLDRVTATAFSFYMGIPILLAAGAYKLVTDDVGGIDGGGWALLVGSVASFVTALIVVGWLLRFISKHNFKPFAYYRIAFGLVILVLFSLGALG